MRFWKSLAVSVLSTLLAVALGLWLSDWLLPYPPFLLLVLPVVVSAYCGGLGMGLFATWVNATLGRLLFLDPPYSLTVSHGHDLAILLLFTTVGTVISIMAPFARRGHQLELQFKLEEKERVFRETALEEKAIQDERQRLSRELHDSVSQALFGIGLGARTALAKLPTAPAEGEAPLRYVLTLAESALADMRALVQELRPEMLENEGLAAALQQQANAMGARYGLEVVLRLEEPETSLTLKHGLYRVAMEALHNVVKHAKATRVNVRLERAGGVVLLEVIDDGRGFDPAGEYPGHWGIRTMRERVERLGGKLNLSSRQGEGTLVQVSLPYAAP